MKLFQDGLTVDEEQELTEHFEHYLFYHNLPHNRRAYLCTHCVVNNLAYGNHESGIWEITIPVSQKS